MIERARDSGQSHKARKFVVRTKIIIPYINILSELLKTFSNHFKKNF